MLRRRILASAMASVMALGSVAIVASAEETAVKPVKTKDDLAALIGANGTYGDTYRSNDIYNYGTVFGDLMLDTLEFADTVLDNPEADLDDFTAAYDMVVAVAERFVLKTATDLKELLDACKNDYERENINNEELGDLIYTPDSFSTFEDKYEDAEAVLNSNDTRIITDAWLELKAAKDGLAPYDPVTKSAFTNAIKAMEKALDKELAYDQWRRGTTVDPSQKISMTGDGQWWYYSGEPIAYGEMFDQLKTYTDFVYKKYDEFVEVKTASKTTLEDIVTASKIAINIADIINGFKADDTNRATKSSVTKILAEYHGRMVFDFERAETLALYAAICDVVGDVEAENVKGLYDTEYVVTTPGDAGYIVSYTDDGKLASATMNIKASKTFYITLDEEGYAAKDAAGDFIVSVNEPEAGNYKKIATKVKVDLTNFIKVQAASVAGVDDHWNNGVRDADNWFEKFDFTGAYDGTYGGDPAADPQNAAGKQNHVTLGNVLPIVYNYLAAEKPADYEASGIRGYLDQIGTIAKDSAKGSAAEWTIVYRALKYVLEDRYGNGVFCKHTRKDVHDLIEDSYTLEAKTSKAAIFADQLQRMIDVREDARDWLKLANADKKYKDNISAYDLTIDGTKKFWFADRVFHELEAEVSRLQDQLDHFAISFGDVYDLIAEVEDAINEGDLEATAEVKAALSEAAYCLAVATEPSWEAVDADADLDDEPYTDDRYFLEYNRVYTSDDGTYEKLTVKSKKLKVFKTGNNTALKAAYDALKAAAEAKPELKGDYDGNGKVDALDAAAILKDIANAAELKAIGDYDANGVVNALDAAAILKAVADGVL